MDAPTAAGKILWSSAGVLFIGDDRRGAPVDAEMTACALRFRYRLKPDDGAETDLTLPFSGLIRIYPRLALFSSPSLMIEAADGRVLRYLDDLISSGADASRIIGQLEEMQQIVKRANPEIRFSR
ncbi:hypothetical protein [Collinsella vaginalis]|uniref:hypothetical protein n=1 Tax=Collinsella vaginalis TaxID=1870987 RepID=UPI000A26B4A2|nr:hypothetical protein [Collinsella vaginalis]